MKRSRTILMLVAAAAITAGCNGDIGKQLASNELLRTQVFDALAANPQLAMQAIDRVVQGDTLRAQVVEHMLANDDIAKQVLVRIGTNPAALDMVVGIAAKDSTMRDHLVTLVKGIEMASK
ncbi:MAG: hypothetical protein IPJ04_12080 [Candidatus Eisenbacteria bacterium]|nr:hypothetical protein [Candidatus Eisenbacteria bacterium]